MKGNAEPIGSKDNKTKTNRMRQHCCTHRREWLHTQGLAWAQASQDPSLGRAESPEVPHIAEAIGTWWLPGKEEPVFFFSGIQPLRDYPRSSWWSYSHTHSAALRRLNRLFKKELHEVGREAGGRAREELEGREWGWILSKYIVCMYVCMNENIEY